MHPAPKVITTTIIGLICLAGRASSIKSAMSVYTNAASEFSDGTAAGGEAAAGCKDLEAGVPSGPAAAAAEAPASGKRRMMLVPTDSGMVRATSELEVNKHVCVPSADLHCYV